MVVSILQFLAGLFFSLSTLVFICIADDYRSVSLG